MLSNKDLKMHSRGHCFTLSHLEPTDVIFLPCNYLSISGIVRFEPRLSQAALSHVGKQISLWGFWKDWIYNRKDICARRVTFEICIFYFKSSKGTRIKYQHNILLLVTVCWVSKYNMYTVSKGMSSYSTVLTKEWKASSIIVLFLKCLYRIVIYCWLLWL